MSDIEHPSQEACEEAARRANQLCGLHCDENHWKADMVNRFNGSRPFFPSLRAMAFLIDEVKDLRRTADPAPTRPEYIMPSTTIIADPIPRTFAEECAIEAMKIMLANADGNYGTHWLSTIADDATDLARLMNIQRMNKFGDAS